ncbi:hypothetical protein [Sinomonas sp. P10A9]|uniref:Tripartite tricarboxylate transporter TctB family protein n=1 Tax=Sinomonas puerhi TaxID=3238584 RepID=A0AB39L456_9MICC
MSAVTRTRFGWATGAVGLATVVLFAVVFAMPGVPAKSMLYNAAFVALTLTLALFMLGTARAPGEKLGFRPGTRLGWWAVALVVASAAVFGLGGLLVPLGVPMALFSGLALVGLVAGGGAAIVAWFRHAERSMLVLLVMLPVMVVPYVALGMIVFPY